MAKTLQEQYMVGLLARGYKEMQTVSTKYRVFRKGTGVWIWLGKAGSVRMSAVRRIDASRPVSQEGKDKILSWGRGEDE